VTNIVTPSQQLYCFIFVGVVVECCHYGTETIHIDIQIREFMKANVREVDALNTDTAFVGPR
jgi:hypothetical protein